MLNIVVRTTFEGLHCWPECPYEEVAFLRNPHRHLFHVTVKCSVTHSDRELEFFILKRDLDLYIKTLNYNLGQSSCEDLCNMIYANLVDNYPTINYVSVFEDGENGAELILENKV